MPTAEPPLFIEEAPPDLRSWMACFAFNRLPVLARSTRAIAELAAHEDDLDAHRLSQSLTDDPLLCLRLLAHVAKLSRGRGQTETIVEALVMLGISPFFRDFNHLTPVEELLRDLPWALGGFRQVLRRAHRASQFAVAFAVHRMDHDVAVIREAALLHDFAELLLWVRAPSLAREIALRLQGDSTLRSAAVQRELLNVTLGQLQHALMQAWRLPQLLVHISDDRPSSSPQARNVQLAIRLARHTSHSWDNAAVPDDLRDVAELLQLGLEPTYRLLREIDQGH